jgi:hypothetical protein
MKHILLLTRVGSRPPRVDAFDLLSATALAGRLAVAFDLAAFAFIAMPLVIIIIVVVGWW